MNIEPKYRIEIFWSDEDGGYIANVPDLRYCSAFGETYEEALREVLEAMELHLDTLRELGRLIPAPDSRRLLGTSTIVLNTGQVIELTEEASEAAVQSVEEIGEGFDSIVQDVSESAGSGVADVSKMRLSREFFETWAETLKEHTRGSAAEEREPNATEAAKRKAEELGVDLSQIEGSGAQGRVTVRDVIGAEEHDKS